MNLSLELTCVSEPARGQPIWQPMNLVFGRPQRSLVALASP
jgi:hypothetical protein